MSPPRACSLDRTIGVVAASASSNETPGFRRPILAIQRLRGTLLRSKHSQNATSASQGSSQNRSGITPMIVRWPPPMRTVLWRTSGVPPSRVFQNLWLRMIGEERPVTGASSGANVRPRAGRTPSTSKMYASVDPARTFSVSPSPRVTGCAPPSIPSSSKDRFCSRIACSVAKAGVRCRTPRSGLVSHIATSRSGSRKGSRRNRTTL